MKLEHSSTRTRASLEDRTPRTRALERSYSSTRALVLELERSSTRTRYSTRLELASASQLDFEFARSNIVHEGTIIISMHAQELINSTPVRIWRMSVTDTRYVHGLCTVPLLGARLAIKRFSLLATQTFLQCSNFVIIDTCRYETLSHCTSDQMTGSLHLRYSLPLAIA